MIHPQSPEQVLYEVVRLIRFLVATERIDTPHIALLAALVKSHDYRRSLWDWAQMIGQQEPPAALEPPQLSPSQGSGKWLGANNCAGTPPPESALAIP